MILRGMPFSTGAVREVQRILAVERRRQRAGTRVWRLYKQGGKLVGAFTNGRKALEAVGGGHYLTQVTL